MKRQVRSAEYLRTLGIIYAAQAGILLIFSVVVLYLKPIGTVDGEQAQLLQYILMGTLVVGLTISQFIPKTLLKQINPALPLKSKMPKLIPVYIIRAACLEMPGVFACAVVFMTGQLYLLVLTPLLLILFYLYRPTINSIVEELGLSQTEKNQLEDPNAIISEMDDSSN